MAHLVLVRHAETALAGTFCGHIDPPLSSSGRAQLPSLIQASEEWKIRHVYASDLARARQTAEAIAGANGASLALLSELREIGFGEWEGLRWDEIQARAPDTAARWLFDFPNSSAPGGEAYADFSLRVRKAARSFFEQVKVVPIAVVTHAGVMREILKHICDIDYDTSWQWTRSYGAWIVIRQDRTIMKVSAASGEKNEHCHKEG